MGNINGHFSEDEKPQGESGPTFTSDELFIASRRRNGLRVDLTPEEWHERGECVAAIRAGGMTPEERQIVTDRLMVLDYGRLPSAIPAWVREAARGMFPGTTRSEGL